MVFSPQLSLSISQTQQLNSWEFWGLWYLDWQQRTSKHFTASVPILCQAVALIRGGSVNAHFYAIRGISFPTHQLFGADKTFGKCTTPFFCDPNSAADMTAVDGGHMAAVPLCSIIVGSFGLRFGCNMIFLLVDPNPLHVFFFFDHDFHF